MLIERLMKVALLGSEWVLYLLLFLSVVSISTMLERFLYFRRHRDDLGRLRRELAQKLSDDQVEEAAALLDKSPAIEARVAREALRWLPGGPGSMGDAVESELGRLKKELERGSNLLGTLGNNAPFVGLLGTVLGVIIAFNALGTAGQNTSQMGGVMAGIAEALIATGVGLFVALPAVIGYNVIQKRVGDIEAEALSLAKLVTAYAKAEKHAPSALARSARDSAVSDPARAVASDASELGRRPEERSSSNGRAANVA
jgi:biopolymer transport protein ExbB/biopolymer transport protein TolQ